MCIEYYIYVNVYYVSAQIVDERAINVHYYNYYYESVACEGYKEPFAKKCKSLESILVPTMTIS